MKTLRVLSRLEENPTHSKIIESLKVIPPGSVFFVLPSVESNKRVSLFSPLTKICRAGIYLGGGKSAAFSVEKGKVVKRPFTEFLYGDVSVFWYTKATVKQLQQLKSFLYDYAKPVEYATSVDLVTDAVNASDWPWVTFGKKQKTMSEVLAWLESDKARNKYWEQVWVLLLNSDK